MSIPLHKLQAAVEAIAGSIDEVLFPEFGGKAGYVVMLIDPADDGHVAYALNIDNKAAVALMKGWIGKVESGKVPDGNPLVKA